MSIGFIGCGNMARAIIKGILNKGLVKPEHIVGSNTTEERARSTHDELGIVAITNNVEVVRQSDVVFLSVKPQQYETVIHEIAESVTPDKVVVSIAPGKTLAWISECFGKSVKLVRTMPNTPALVGQGITAYCENDQVIPDELHTIEQLLESFGRIEHVKESLMDAACAVGGSGPAYVYQFIEALADGAVAEGLPRIQATEIAAQMVLGSAKMVLETGKHPGQLKDEVCSPGGTTIKGVEALEEAGFRGAVMRAVRAAAGAARGM